jgi:hypothetical protein
MYSEPRFGVAKAIGRGFNLVFWALIGAIATAVLAVWQTIATHYTRRALAMLVNDRKLLAALGKNLRESGIVLPGEFTGTEKTILDNPRPESVARIPR